MSVLLWLLFINLFAPASFFFIPLTVPMRIEPYEDLFRAVKLVETGDRDTINITEGAYGRTQIRQCKLDDYNRVTGSTFVLEDCMKEELSRKIFMWHMMQYNDTDLAVRRWNGSGPATYLYLKKVKARL